MSFQTRLKHSVSPNPLYIFQKFQHFKSLFTRPPPFPKGSGFRISSYSLVCPQPFCEEEEVCFHALNKGGGSSSRWFFSVMTVSYWMGVFLQGGERECHMMDCKSPNKQCWLLVLLWAGPLFHYSPRSLKTEHTFCPVRIVLTPKQNCLRFAIMKQDPITFSKGVKELNNRRQELKKRKADMMDVDWIWECDLCPYDLGC